PALDVFAINRERLGLRIDFLDLTSEHVFLLFRGGGRRRRGWLRLRRFGFRGLLAPGRPRDGKHTRGDDGQSVHSGSLPRVARFAETQRNGSGFLVLGSWFLVLGSWFNECPTLYD